MLRRAIASVVAQTRQPAVLMVEHDNDHTGAAATRNRALMDVKTEWVAFLDDDDEFMPRHLYELTNAATSYSADYLWSRFVIEYPTGERKDGPWFLGEKAFSQWNDGDPCQTTITTMVRTELARDAGGFAQFTDEGQEVDGQRRGEDHEFTLRCRAAGGVFRHVPIVTWIWHHHGVGARGVPGNTSGMPDRW
jgi:glycosyltransferase involved in cell wall biosynthesis